MNGTLSPRPRKNSLRMIRELGQSLIKFPSRGSYGYRSAAGRRAFSFFPRPFGRPERIDGNAEIQNLFRLQAALGGEFEKRLVVGTMYKNLNSVRKWGAGTSRRTVQDSEKWAYNAIEKSLHPGFLEVIMGNPGGIHSALVPAVQDFQNFKPPILINEGPGSFFSLVSGITFHGNVLKNPFFFHTFHRRDRRARRR